MSFDTGRRNVTQMDHILRIVQRIDERVERIEAKISPKVEVKRRPAHLRSVKLDDERIET